jgi:hypothetical protein
MLIIVLSRPSQHCGQSIDPNPPSADLPHNDTSDEDSFELPGEPGILIEPVNKAIVCRIIATFVELIPARILACGGPSDWILLYFQT